MARSSGIRATDRGGQRDRSWRGWSPGEWEQRQRRQQRRIGGNAQVQGRKVCTARVESKKQSTTEESGEVDRHQPTRRRKQGGGEREERNHGYNRTQMQAGPSGRSVRAAAPLPFIDAHAIDPAKQRKEEDGRGQLLFPY